MENLEKRYFPPQHGHAGSVGEHCRAAPERPTPHKAALWDATSSSDFQNPESGQSPCLGSKHWAISCQFFSTLTPRGNLLSREGPCRFWRRSQRAQAQGWRALCLRRMQPRRMLSSPPRRELRQGIGFRVRVPRHTRRRRLLGTHSSRQSPEPLVPVAAGTGMSGRAGARAITSFPYSTKPSPDPARTTKDSLRFPTVSAVPLFPPQNQNLVLAENRAFLPDLFQSSRAEPLLQLSHQDWALSRIPPSQGLSAPC